MKRNTRKGFTGIELVIVIAIIAILASALIPTFGGLINSANETADKQAVREMNTWLMAEEVSDKPTNLDEAIKALSEVDLNLEGYKPLAKDMYFYWIRSLNRVVYTDADKKVEYPEDLKDTTYDPADGWFSLCGEIEEDDDWKQVISNGSVTISDGAQFVSLMNAFFNKDSVTNGVTEIVLTNDIDLMGAAANFGEVTHNLIIKGNGATIYGLRSEVSAFKSDNNSDKTMSSYGYGLIGKIAADAEVTVENINFKDAVITAPKNAGSAGIVAGYVAEGATLNIENVTIDNCVIRAEKKAASLVGYLQTGSMLNIAGKVDIKNTSVSGGREVAAVIAFVQQTKSLNVADNAEISVDVNVSADPSFGFTYSDTHTMHNHTHTFTNEPNGFAIKGTSVYLGVTTKHYWDTVGGLTVDTNFKNGKIATQMIPTDFE